VNEDDANPGLILGLLQAGFGTWRWKGRKCVEIPILRAGSLKKRNGHNWQMEGLANLGPPSVREQRPVKIGKVSSGLKR